jgi:NitT/TauT family transport system permease protein
MRVTVRRPIAARLDYGLGVMGIGVLAAVWCILTYGHLVKPAFLPTPSGIWDGLVGFHHRNWLFPAIGRSFWRVTKSLLLVTAIGVPIGIAMGAFPAVDAVLRKIVNGAKSIPTTGMVGLIILWFSIEEKAKIVFLVLGAVFYMIILAKNAVLNVSEDYVRVALDLGANSRQVIWRVLLPGALPQIWEALAVCNGIMWTYIILAEFINSNEEQLGLGYLLFVGSRTQESGKVFAALIVIALISVLTDFVLHTVRKRSFDW